MTVNKKGGQPGAAAGPQPALSLIYITPIGRAASVTRVTAAVLSNRPPTGTHSSRCGPSCCGADLAAARAAHGAANARRCRGVAGPQEHHVRRSGRRAGPRRVTLALHDSAARNNFHPPDSRLPGATAGGGGSGTLGSRPRGLNLSCVATGPTSATHGPDVHAVLRAWLRQRFAA